MIKKISNINIDISIIILVFVSLFTIVYYQLSFDGLLFSDDFTYGYFAHQFINQKFNVSDDIFSHRFGVFLPTGFFYFLFGVNDYTTTAWPLICQLTSLLILFFLFKREDKLVFAFAVIFSGLNFYTLYFSNKLFPDVIVSFFCLLTVLILFKLRNSNSTGKNLLSAFLFVVSVFCGFLSKETIIYLFPFFLLLFINDLMKRQSIKFWVFSFCFFLVGAAIFLLLYKYFTGDYFYRFKIIQAGHYPTGYSYFDKPFSALVPRLTYEPLIMMISTEMIIPFIFALPIFFKIRLKSFFSLDDKVNFWNILLLVILIMFWFGSTSYKFYNPISLNARMFIMVMPAMAVVGAMGLIKSRENNFINLLYSLGFFLITVFSFFFINHKVVFIYFPLALFFVFLYLSRKYFNKVVPTKIYAAVLILILLIHPVFVIMKPSETDFKNEKEIVLNYLNSDKGKNLVITDFLMSRGHIYYFKFNPRKNYTYVSNQNLQSIEGGEFDNVLVLTNKKTILSMQEMGYYFPDFYLQPLPQWKLIVKRGDVALYKATSLEDFKKDY